MKETIDAVFENGVFRPLSDPHVGEGQHVHLTVEVEAPLEPESILALAASVYEGLSEEDIREVEAIALDRSNFFRRDPK